MASIKRLCQVEETSSVADLPTGPKEPDEVLSVEEEAVMSPRRYTLLRLMIAYALQPRSRT